MTLAAVNRASRLAAEQQLGEKPYSWQEDCLGSWLLAIRVNRLRLLVSRGEHELAEREAREYGIGLDEI